MRLKPALMQYRLAANTRATLLLFAFPFVLRLAHAADFTPLAAENQTNLIPSSEGLDASFPLGSYNGLEIRDGADESEGTGVLDLVRRASSSDDASSLGNNQFKQSTVKIGDTEWWYLPKKELSSEKSNNASPALPAFLSKTTDNENDSRQDLRKRNGGVSRRSTLVYISLTACSKPDLDTTNTDLASALPRLELYVSSEKPQKPSPGENTNQGKHVAEGGYIATTMEADGDVYIGVTVQNATGYSGGYDYQIAASVDAFFHRIKHDDRVLFFIDSDNNAALLTTNNLTESSPGSDNYNEWMATTPPYTMFANNVNDTSISGLERSWCALDKLAQIGKGNKSLEVSMTSRGLSNNPKEQFYLTDLNQSSTYLGILAMDGNSTDSGNGVVGGGGTVWKPISFETKSDDNCAVIFDLSFCTDVAYAVPSNPSFNLSHLKTTYDDYAQSFYKNFSYSLQQVQCDADPSNMFSLAVNCSNCEDAYKDWLCAVTIPRCTDFSNPDTFLQTRNAGQKFLNGSTIPSNDPLRTQPASNSSRNKMIDETIQPGPYNEILPCKDLCYNLVQSCPASLGFSCPSGKWLNSSYGWRVPDGDVTCSYPGAAYFLMSASQSIHGSVWFVLYTISIFWGFFWSLG